MDKLGPIISDSELQLIQIKFKPKIIQQELVVGNIHAFHDSFPSLG